MGLPKTVNAAAALIILLLPCCQMQIFPVPRVEDQTFWLAQASMEIEEAISAATSQNWGIAKNVVVFVGDGMGITPSVAARIYKGQQRHGNSGEEAYLSWERFPNLALMKTYNLDKQVSGSASSATALFCGSKVNNYVISLDSSVLRDQCLESLNPEVQLSSVMSWAQEAGKDTGFVTTTTITNGTPAPLYAHTPNREWECDAKLGTKGQGCKDIAKQLVEDAPGTNAKVILGGGRRPMGVSNEVDVETCTRIDGRNLTNEWILNKTAQGHHVSYVENTEDLLDVDIQQTDYLMGLFAEGHMPYETKRDKGPQGHPSLANMTSVAIKMLSKNKQRGFFLMVEGGTIDQVLHETKSRTALEDVLALDDAVNTALSMLDLSETLVIVTADHSHTMTINGYPKRGNNILGLSGIKSTVDDLPYTTIMYATGPSYDHFWNGTNVTRPDVSKQDTIHFDYKPLVAVPNHKGTHGGEDVAAYATGPMSHLFHTLHELSYVAHVMGFAACMGPYKSNCNRSTDYLHNSNNNQTIYNATEKGDTLPIVEGMFYNTTGKEDMLPQVEDILYNTTGKDDMLPILQEN